MNMSTFAPDNKKLVLGTALWGWGIERREAYELLEHFLQSGGSIVDTATNYPINKHKEDFGLAVSWIADWVQQHGDTGLALTVKIGSRDNMGSPDVNLTPDHIERAADTLKSQFGDALSCISIHWDNRADDEHQLAAIAQTVDAMSKLEKAGFSIGLSGIKHPELYFKAAPTLAEKWIIQVKENFMTRAAREAYQTWFPKAKYLAYGINLGGLKIEAPKTNSSIELRQINIPQSLTERLGHFLNSDHGFVPRPMTLNELAMAASYVNPSLSGVVIGPRNIEQLENTLAYWKSLEEYANKPKGLQVFNQLSKDLSPA
jgi:aryl-alcohol dehydrogenase-like predicted oxidoreductase